MKRETIFITKYADGKYLTCVDRYLIWFINDYTRNTCTCIVDFYDYSDRYNRVNQVIGNVMSVQDMYNFMGDVYSIKDIHNEIYTISFGTTYHYCITTQCPSVFGPSNKVLTY